MSMFTNDMIWWIGAVELPALGGLFWMIWRTRQESEESRRHLREIIDTRSAQLRDALAAFKLEVAKSYASITDMKELEARLVAHLLRIETKLEVTAMKTEALNARKEKGE